jgi:hypothetical protein
MQNQQNNDEEKQKLWKIYKIFMGIMIGGGTLILTTQWVWGTIQNAIQDNERKAAIQNSINKTSSQQSPSPSPAITTNPNPNPSPVQTSVSETTNPYAKLSYPQPVCGDPLPIDPKAYPVNLYPVFAPYSDTNLQAIKTRFCSDAIQKFREKKNIESVQVASFSSIERAKKFRDFLSKNRFSGVEVGEPTNIPTKR